MAKDGCKILVSVLFLLMCGGAEVADAQNHSDLDLLRSVEFDSPREERYETYGLVEGKSTFSPIYHAMSGVWWVWQNAIAPEVANPGGYTDTNANYFKKMVEEYGLLRALILFPDRIVRNTKVGRATTTTTTNGLIEDNPKRYRR